jgi:hypothetical protein
MLKFILVTFLEIVQLIENIKNFHFSRKKFIETFYPGAALLRQFKNVQISWTTLLTKIIAVYFRPEILSGKLLKEVTFLQKVGKYRCPYMA